MAEQEQKRAPEAKAIREAMHEPERARPQHAALNAAGDLAGSRIGSHDALEQELSHAQSLLNATTDQDQAQTLRAIGHEHTVEIDGQHIEIYSAAQAASARRLIPLLKSEFGITLSDAAARKALFDLYDTAPPSERAKISDRNYEYREIVAIAMALRFYAPLLGKRRDKSLGEQPIQFIGKLSSALSWTDGASASRSAVVDTSVMGQAFEKDRTMLTTQSLTNEFDDFEDSERPNGRFKNSGQMELVGTIVHELGHFLMESQLATFMAATGGYWVDVTQAAPGKGESPVTDYGATNAREDLCESLMFFAVDPGRLHTMCPKRYAFIQHAVAAWSATKKP